MCITLAAKQKVPDTPLAIFDLILEKAVSTPYDPEIEEEAAIGKHPRVCSAERVHR